MALRKLCFFTMLAELTTLCRKGLPLRVFRRGNKHWRQHGSHTLAKLGAIRRSILDVGADRPIWPVPTSCGIRSATAPVPGIPLATTSMRQSTRRRGSKHISKLSTQRFRSFKTKTNPVERKSWLRVDGHTRSWLCHRPGWASGSQVFPG
jgi:hypothetical protein